MFFMHMSYSFYNLIFLILYYQHYSTPPLLLLLLCKFSLHIYMCIYDLHLSTNEKTALIGFGKKTRLFLPNYVILLLPKKGVKKRCFYQKEVKFATKKSGKKSLVFLPKFINYKILCYNYHYFSLFFYS